MKLAAFAWILAPGALAQTAGITDLGLLPGTYTTIVNGVSADGLSAAGDGFDAMGWRAFVWRRVGGMQDVMPYTHALGVAISPDGTAIVGGDPAYRWMAGSGQVFLGALGDTSRAMAVSAGGLAVAGHAQTPYGGRAFRWTGQTGMQTLGLLPGMESSWGTGISADGSVVVGWCRPSTGLDRAFRWTSQGGMQDLGLPAGSFGAEANAVSADGSVVAGILYVAPAVGRMFRWTLAGGMENLGMPEGATASLAYGISGDGSTVVGWAYASGDRRAVLWTRGLGTVELRAVLASQGVNTAAWQLHEARGASANGTAIVGNDEARGWIATLPASLLCYTNCDHSTIAPALTVADFTCFLNAFASAEPYANCDASTAPPVLNVLDFVCFLNRFSTGCP